MENFVYTVKSELGMHARPAGLLVKLAGRHRATIAIHKGEKVVSVNRILAVMGLEIRQGEQVHFTVDGEDEAAALAELRQICEESL